MSVRSVMIFQTRYFFNFAVVKKAIGYFKAAFAPSKFMFVVIGIVENTETVVMIAVNISNPDDLSIKFS